MTMGWQIRQSSNAGKGEGHWQREVGELEWAWDTQCADMVVCACPRGCECGLTCVCRSMEEEDDLRQRCSTIFTAAERCAMSCTTDGKAYKAPRDNFGRYMTGKRGLKGTARILPIGRKTNIC